MPLPDDDIAGYLLDAYRYAQSKGLRRLLCVQIGETEPQWQVSSRFQGATDYHVSIKPDLLEAVMDALTPPAQAPASMKPAEVAEALASSGGLFD